MMKQLLKAVERKRSRTCLASILGAHIIIKFEFDISSPSCPNSVRPHGSCHQLHRFIRAQAFASFLSLWPSSLNQVSTYWNNLLAMPHANMFLNRWWKPACTIWIQFLLFELPNSPFIGLQWFGCERRMEVWNRRSTHNTLLKNGRDEGISDP